MGVHVWRGGWPWRKRAEKGGQDWFKRAEPILQSFEHFNPSVHETHVPPTHMHTHAHIHTLLQCNMHTHAHTCTHIHTQSLQTKSHSIHTSQQNTLNWYSNTAMTRQNETPTYIHFVNILEDPHSTLQPVGFWREGQ